MSAILLYAVLFLSAPPELSSQAKKPPTVDTLKQQLASPLWSERDRALRLIAQIPGTQSDKVRDALLDALESETKTITSGMSPDSEDFAEYYSRLLQATTFAWDPENSEAFNRKAASTLLRAIYNPNSAFAQSLGRGGSAFAIPAVNCASSNDPSLRSNCLAVIGWILGADSAAKPGRARLKNADRELLLRTLRTEVLGGGIEVARFWAILALSYAGDVDSIPLLERIDFAERGRVDKKSPLLPALSESLERLRNIK